MAAASSRRPWTRPPRPPREDEPRADDSRRTAPDRRPRLASSPIVPVYVYRRDDGSTFEIEQRMTADALLSCPTSGRAVERVLQPFAPRYTGSGFYSTDQGKPSGRTSPTKREE